MQYITHTRYKAISQSGPVNIPAQTVCEEKDCTIYHQGKKLCFVTSEDAHQYFARNDDGQGMRRGELIKDIQKLLRKDCKSEDPESEKKRQKRWDKVWGAPALLRYKRPEHPDHWLWNHAFYNAPIKDLEYIYNLIKGV